jgi:hypothetical protein
MAVDTNPDTFVGRYVNREQARRTYGSWADEFAAHYQLGDPVADALMEVIALQGNSVRQEFQQALEHGSHVVSNPHPAWKAFFKQVEDVPAWVDFNRINLGARTYQRIGSAGMLILSSWSLMNGYHSAPAVKPLMFTKQLDQMALRRLAETGRFVTETTQVDGLRRFGLGFKIGVHVRLMHAMVRRNALRQTWWRNDEWGIPINQADMIGTLIEFSLLVLHGASLLGFQFSREEREAVVHLWRYAGYIGGVEPKLLRCLSDEPSGTRLAELIHMIQPGPDQDSLDLAEALRNVPVQMASSSAEVRMVPWLVKVHDGLTRAFNGDQIADELRIPNSAWKYVVYPMRAMVTPLELCRRCIPGATGLASRIGNYVIRNDIRKLLNYREPSFGGLHS